MIRARAYDSDPLDTALKERAIELVATPQEQEEAENQKRSQAKALREALEGDLIDHRPLP